MEAILKKITVIMMACLLVAGMAACGSDKAGESSAEPPIQGGEESAAAEELPAFEYSGNEKYQKEISAYLIKEEGPNLAEGDVLIPNPLILDIDESNPEDIKVWGIFELYSYKLKDITLHTISSCSIPGLIHLKKTDGGFEVTAWDQRTDGAGADASLKEICASKAGVYELFTADNEKKLADYRKSFVRMYADHFVLEIDSFQDEGSDPIYIYASDADAAQDDSDDEEETAEDAAAKAAAAAPAAPQPPVDPAVAEYEKPLGHYVSEKKDCTMDILRGGEGLYTINIGIIRLVGLDGVGQYEGDTMHFTASVDVDTDKNVSGEVQGKGGEVVLTITESDWQYLEPGTTFKLKQEA